MWYHFLYNIFCDTKSSEKFVQPYIMLLLRWLLHFLPIKIIYPAMKSSIGTVGYRIKSELEGSWFE